MAVASCSLAPKAASPLTSAYPGSPIFAKVFPYYRATVLLDAGEDVARWSSRKQCVCDPHFSPDRVEKGDGDVLLRGTMSHGAVEESGGRRRGGEGGSTPALPPADLGSDSERARSSGITIDPGGAP
jgi:hypothetical protein